ncbi:w, partial [Symbiodinium sp. KB8]
VRKSFGKQLRQLAKREFRAVVRDRTTLTVRFCLSVVLTFLFGLVFQGVGRTILEADQSIFDQMWTGLTYDEVTALRKRKLEWHFNALVQVALVAMFSACQPVILTFPLERPVFLREYSSGTY